MTNKQKTKKLGKTQKHVDKVAKFQDYDKLFLFGGVVVTLVASYMFYTLFSALFKTSLLLRLFCTLVFFIVAFSIWSYFSKHENKVDYDELSKLGQEKERDILHKITEDDKKNPEFAFKKYIHDADVFLKMYDYTSAKRFYGLASEVFKYVPADKKSDLEKEMEKIGSSLKNKG